MTYVLVFLICMLGGFAAGVTGFGYAIICMVLMSLFLEVKTATLAALVSTFPLYLIILHQAVIKNRVRLDFRMIAVPLLGSITGRYFGVVVFEILSNQILMITLCVFMVILNIYFFFFSDRFKLKPTVANGVFAGLVSGFFGSLNNVGGPPMVAYMYSVEENRFKYTAYLQIIFGLGSLQSLIIHISVGNITESVLNLGIVGLMGISAGAGLGFKLFSRLDSKRLTMLIKCFILLSSLILIIKTFIDFY